MPAIARATSGMYRDNTFFLAPLCFAACARTIFPLSWIAHAWMARVTASMQGRKLDLKARYKRGSSQCSFHLCSSGGGVKWGWRVARSGHDS
jgi:hypothetical protein